MSIKSHVVSMKAKAVTHLVTRPHPHPLEVWHELDEEFVVCFIVCHAVYWLDMCTLNLVERLDHFDMTSLVLNMALYARIYKTNNLLRPV